MPFRRFLKVGSFLTAAIALAVLGIRAVDTNQTQEETQRAKAVLEESLKSDPSNSVLWSHLGFAHHKLGDIDAAQKAFEKSADLNPKNANALYMLGLIYEKKNMTAEALKAWKAVQEVSDDEWRRNVAGKHIHHLNTK